MLHTVYAFKYSYITVGNGRHQIILTQFNIFLSFNVFET